ncbi:MAG: NAD-dependent epimerase/dehydratase family protein [Bacteroidia bacterium]
MHILVTGAAGFIGSHLVEALINQGNHVEGIDNLSTGKKENLPENFLLHTFSLEEADKLTTLFQKNTYDVVFHLAAQVNVRFSAEDPIADARANILGTLNLLEAMRLGGCKRIIFSSTGGAIYGEKETLPISEKVMPEPYSPYGVAKRSVELYLGAYKQMYDISYVALRYANVYGPRQNPLSEAGVVAIFIYHMLQKKRPTINGDGTQTRDYIYVEDVVRANLAALDNPSLEGIFNIGTGIETSLSTLYEILQHYTGYTEKPYHGPPKKGDLKRNALDATLYQKHTAWKPQISLHEGLQKTVAAFQKDLSKNLSKS